MLYLRLLVHAKVVVRTGTTTVEETQDTVNLMKKLEPLKIFNDQAIGKLFMPDGLRYETHLSLIPTIIHGRSIAVKVEEYKWILIKGGGWNFGGPLVYISKKDAELVFGLCPTEAAKREIVISNKIEEFTDDFPKALYYKRFLDYKMPERFDFFSGIKYSDGKLVDPCLLYTQVKFPYRVADLAYLNDKEKEECINLCCKYWKVSREEYIDCFAKKLAEHVAILHKNSFINDTLEYSNVTMLAEIVDYELFTYPGILFEDGDDGQEKPNERKEKEILYASEIVLQLSNFIHKPLTLFETYRKVVDEYKKINLDFINSNDAINKIYNGESVIL